ncbi:CAP domain-containing protein [Kineococcus sp. SYSU DK003]|uniref:CAP domain-containing protein n=1 Tax=Kineococcus sp. SYSU DK003 TaxID=3383124 RepID=UPI003D7D0A01
MTTLPRRPLRTITLAASATATAALTVLALAGPAAADEITPTSTPLEQFEAEVLDRTNAARAAAGCAPLFLDPALTAAADRHTHEMAATGRMTHTGADGSSPRTRLAAEGVHPVRTAENIAYGYDAGSVVDAWLASPGHRANILDCRLRAIGVAEVASASGPFVTQVFAG